MMTLDPLLDAPVAIQMHVVAALLAIVLGPVAMLRRSRDVWHRVAGRVWVAAMTVTAVSSFWIGEMGWIGWFGPIHLLSLFTLWGLIEGMTAIRAGRVIAHRRAMRSSYFWALGVAGLFTLTPGRRMNEVLFGTAPVAGFVVAACLVGVGLVAYVRADRRARAAEGG